ncbi:DnaJ-domain-containing protein [Sistotremastrum niveocremeum HHB9708]|uniref:DnaJ-domain-containing protein n=1 Tax=Sistotremastrum niveocremeum HHB9708 TaxID=1314777 RepID=A0A164WKW8_9AGAM|nr:DnaJ-domain-containing protein [Sistotremastrum niveocremeum HHB9708]
MNFLPRSRCFSSSACRLATHYDTLAIPRDASRAQIKSKFYTLSKELHPDTHPNDPAAKSKFQKITEAYSVLGDERQRCDSSDLWHETPELTLITEEHMIAR